MGYKVVSFKNESNMRRSKGVDTEGSNEEGSTGRGDEEKGVLLTDVLHAETRWEMETYN